MRLLQQCRIMLLLLSIVVAGSCTGRSAGRSVSAARVDVITAAEVDAATHADAYSLVHALRPQWLRVRGTTSFAHPETIKVYLDGSLLGDVSQLRQIATHTITSLRYLDGLQATQRWGLDHGAGAIIISTF